MGGGARSPGAADPTGRATSRPLLTDASPIAAPLLKEPTRRPTSGLTGPPRRLVGAQYGSPEVPRPNGPAGHGGNVCPIHPHPRPHACPAGPTARHEAKRHDRTPRRPPTATASGPTLDEPRPRGSGAETPWARPVPSAHHPLHSHPAYGHASTAARPTLGPDGPGIGTSGTGTRPDTKCYQSA